MPMFTIESNYRIPVYRHRAYEAETLEAACQLAIDDDDWDGSKEDYESPGPTYLSVVWPGDVAPYSVDPLPLPTEFGEPTAVDAQERQMIREALENMAEDIMSMRGREGSEDAPERAAEYRVLAARFGE